MKNYYFCQNSELSQISTDCEFFWQKDGKENVWCTHFLPDQAKGAITSKIKHAMKLKTSPARLAELLQPS